MCGCYWKKETGHQARKQLKHCKVHKATKQIHALSARKSTWTFLPNFSFRIRIFQKYYGLAFAAYFSFLVIMHFGFCLRSRYLRYLQPLQWLGSCQETNWYLSERITWYHIYCSISYIFTRWKEEKHKAVKLLTEPLWNQWSVLVICIANLRLDDSHRILWNYS